MKNFKLIKIFTTSLLALTLITGCSKKTDTIKIATKPMTEQFILGEMLSLLIKENTNLNVEITKGIGGGTSNIHPAILKGDFDLYPEYTGTGWSFVLKESEIPDNDTLYKNLQDKYSTNYNLKWVGLYGQLTSSDVTVLQDDKNFFQSYYCGTVVREDTLSKHPELENILMKMQDIITDSEMAKLNYEVESNGRDEAEVAKEFLQNKGLLKE
ncbi:Choline-binding protein precursor [compost metagenome]